MITCPNKNLTEWRKLVSLVGENRAYVLWAEFEGGVPKETLDSEQIPTIQKALNFLRDYGFTIKDSENFILNLGAKNIDLNTTDIEQVSKALAAPLSKMLAYSDYFSKLQNSLKNSKEFQSRLRSLLNENEDLMYGRAFNKIVGEMTRELLESNFSKKLKKEYNLNNGIINKIKEFIKGIIAYFKNIDLKPIKPLINEIVSKTLEGEKFISTTKKENYEKLDFQNALDRDKKAKILMTKLGTNPNIALTGSIAYAPQGTIYRDKTKNIHDVDFKVLNNTFDVQSFVKKEFPNAVQVNDFISEGTEVKTYSIPAFDLGIEFKEPKGNLSKEEWDKAIEEQQLLVDFFVDKEKNFVIKHPFKASDGKTYFVNLVDYSLGFNSKLNIMREKDVWDYLNFIPNKTIQTSPYKARRATSLELSYLLNTRGRKVFEQLDNMTLNDYVAEQKNMGMTDDMILENLKTCKGF